MYIENEQSNKTGRGGDENRRLTGLAPSPELSGTSEQGRFSPKGIENDFRIPDTAPGRLWLGQGTPLQDLRKLP